MKRKTRGSRYSVGALLSGNPAGCGVIPYYRAPDGTHGKLQSSLGDLGYRKEEPWRNLTPFSQSLPPFSGGSAEPLSPFSWRLCLFMELAVWKA